MDSSDFKSNESFFKKDSPDQKSGFGFAERNAKSVFRSQIRFWIHRKEHTLGARLLWFRLIERGMLHLERACCGLRRMERGMLHLERACCGLWRIE